MDRDPLIFSLDDDSQKRFEASDEVFPGVQLGVINPEGAAKRFVVVNGMIAVSVQPELINSLNRFYAETWSRYRQGQRTAAPVRTIEQLYEDWYNKSLTTLDNVQCEPASRSTLTYFATTGSMPPTPPTPPPPVSPPSPPPTRPTLHPALTPPPGPPVHGHLPFQDVTTDFEIFYRFEAYPTSRRVTTGAQGSFISGTFASPASELPFLPTGFSAVARNALPNFFPAVFRYELAPAPGANIMCGAVVPMFGQSGGGVEVLFMDRVTNNRGAIANAAVVLPF